MVLPLILAGVATFASGAWIGSIVDDATEQPSVTIQQATVTEEKPLTRKHLHLYGALGVGAYLFYRKYLRK